MNVANQGMKQRAAHVPGGEAATPAALVLPPWPSWIWGFNGQTSGKLPALDGRKSLCCPWTLPPFNSSGHAQRLATFSLSPLINSSRPKTIN